MSAADLNGTGLRQLASTNQVKAGLTIGTAATPNIKTTTTPVWTINGLFCTLGGAYPSTLLTVLPTALPQQAFYPVPGVIPGTTAPQSYTCYVLIMVNAAGAFYGIQGDYKGRDLTAFGMAAKGDGQVPECPLGYAPMAVMKIVTVAGGAGFKPGVDNMDASAKAAVTFYDVQMVPYPAP